MASKRDERYSSSSILFNRSFKLINPIDWHLFKLWVILSSLEIIRLNFHFSLSLIINFREKETVKCFIKSNSRIKSCKLSLKIKPIKIHMKESNLSWVNSWASPTRKTAHNPFDHRLNHFQRAAFRAFASIF